jgi:hypothetical protein
LATSSKPQRNERTEMKHLAISIAISLMSMLSGCHHLEVEADTDNGLLDPHVHIDFSALEIHKK